MKLNEHYTSEQIVNQGVFNFEKLNNSHNFIGEVFMARKRYRVLFYKTAENEFVLKGLCNTEEEREVDPSYNISY